MRDVIHAENEKIHFAKRARLRAPGSGNPSGTVKPFTRWSSEGEKYMLSMVKFWGKCKGLLEEGRNHFHPQREPRQLLEIARRIFGSLERPSAERIRSVLLDQVFR